MSCVIYLHDITIPGYRCRKDKSDCRLKCEYSEKSDCMFVLLIADEASSANLALIIGGCVGGVVCVWAAVAGAIAVWWWFTR